MSKSPEKKSGKVNYVWVLAGGYLAYLGAQLLFGVRKSETPMIGLIGGLVFVIVGGLLMLREWRAYKYGLDHIDDPDSWSEEDETLPEAEEEAALPEADFEEPAEEDET